MNEAPPPSQTWVPPSDIPSSLYREYDWHASDPMTPLELVLHVLIALVLLGLGVYGFVYSFSFI
jgi:hypothetical protein